MRIRVNKFRGWNGKEWITDFSIHASGAIPSGLIACQFTGCFDYKGKEIYEGDILWANDKNWKVIFNGGSFVAWGPGRWKAIPNLWQPTIAGNIYENPKIYCTR